VHQQDERGHHRRFAETGKNRGVSPALCALPSALRKEWASDEMKMRDVRLLCAARGGGSD